MTAENMANGENAAFVNGNAATISNQPNFEPKIQPNDSLFATIILTIYDVIVFLSCSIGIIIQVSIALISVFLLLLFLLVFLGREPIRMRCL